MDDTKKTISIGELLRAEANEMAQFRRSYQFAQALAGADKEVMEDQWLAENGNRHQRRAAEARLRRARKSNPYAWAATVVAARLSNA